MIKYTLSCASGCRFEAWFPNSEACNAQLSDKQISCPLCGSQELSKALMAPSISTAKQELPVQDAPEASEPQTSSEPAVASGLPPSVENHRRAMEERLRALRAHIESTADNVGDAFASEARKIHDGESEERAIYGNATPDEVEELTEDGIPVAPIPWINRRDD